MSLSLLVAGVLAAGCGSTTTETGIGPMLASDLPGWHAVKDSPGIFELSPNLSGLTVTGRQGRPALVRRGDAIRFAVIGLATHQEAVEVINRASGDDYVKALERALHGKVTRREGLAGYRLAVPRLAEPGNDTVELFVDAGYDEVVLVEFVSAHGFDPRLRAEILGLVSR